MVVGGKVRHPPGSVHAVVGGHTYRISPGVFWQVHAGAAAALLSAVLDLAGRCAGLSVVDLYAGAGLFSVPSPMRSDGRAPSWPWSATGAPVPTPGTTGPRFPTCGSSKAT